MAMSEAKKQANKKWNDANMKERYDRIQLVVPKGKKEQIQACAKLSGESVNAFMNRLIDAEIADLYNHDIEPDYLVNAQPIQNSFEKFMRGEE